MASPQREDFIFLSDEDYNKYKESTNVLEQLSTFKAEEVLERLNRLSLSTDFSGIAIPDHSSRKDDLRIVMIGKTGQGKSATANTIFGEKIFKDDFTSSSVTVESLRKTKQIDGRTVSVMDTPGLQDTHHSNQEILKEIAKITKFYPDGVHAFLYVMNLANPRFTAEDKKVLDYIEKNLGGHFKNYCLLVLTHGESLSGPENLDSYMQKQKQLRAVERKNKKDVKDQKSLQVFLQEISWKVLAIDNSSTVPFECMSNRDRIISMIDKMRERNYPDLYTNDMFEKAQEEREKLRVTGLKEGWDESVMHIVEELIAADPKISPENLEIAVHNEIKTRSEKRARILQDTEREIKTLREESKTFQETLEMEKRKLRKNMAEEAKRQKERMEQEEEKRNRQWEQKMLLQQKQLQKKQSKEEERVRVEYEKQREQMQRDREEWEQTRRAEEEELQKYREEHQRQLMEREKEILRQKEDEMERRKKLEEEEKEREEKMSQLNEKYLRLREDQRRMDDLLEKEKLKTEEIRKAHESWLDRAFDSVLDKLGYAYETVADWFKDKLNWSD